MFDLATQPQPLPATGAALGLPFDWRLTAPTGLANYPYTDYATPTAAPLVAGEMLATYALALEDGLQTAVIISLFTDSRADRDAVLPLNQADRRGWVGDEFMGDAPGARADAWGSALWLVYISKVTPDVLERARFAAQEALAWLVRDGIASRVVATAQWAGPALDRLALRCAIYKPDQLAPVYDVLWGTSLRRLDALAAPEGAVACCDPPATPEPTLPPALSIVQYPPAWQAGLAYEQIAPAPGFVRVLVDNFASLVPLTLVIFISQPAPSLRAIGRGFISVSSGGYYDVPIDSINAAQNLVVQTGTTLRAVIYTDVGDIYANAPSRPIDVFQPVAVGLLPLEINLFNTEPPAYGFNLTLGADRPVGTYRLKYWPSLVSLTLAEFYGVNHPDRPTYFVHDAAVDQPWFHLLYVVNNAHHGESWVVWHDETASVVSTVAAVPLNPIVI
jgi:phage gp46-like protein